MLLIDRIDNERSDNEVDLVDKIDLRNVLETLKPQEKQIIILRYYKEKPSPKLQKCLVYLKFKFLELKKILEDIRKNEACIKISLYRNLHNIIIFVYCFKIFKYYILLFLKI